MNNKRVKVLLSSYNGEKYIEEQVESILNQSYKNIELYIRDDGSKDRTPEILRKYEESDRSHVLTGENVGFIKSFFALIKDCGDADYFAFADQEDVWLPDKISMALEKMETEAHDIMLEHIPEYSCGHDWWTYMICSGMGKVVYDDRVTVKYRRTGGNVSPSGMGFLKFQVWRFKKFFVNDYFADVRKQQREFYRLYTDKLQKENVKLLYLFSEEKYHMGMALKKVLYPKRFRCGIMDEMFVRFIF